jgi:hypothetical protein
MSLKIEPYETDKSKIKLTPNMKNNIICKPPCAMYLCGASGAGKTQLLLNLMKKQQFYKDYFDDIYLISTSAKEGDDLYQKNLKIKKQHIFDPESEDAIDAIEKIVASQKKIIKKMTIDKSPKVLIMFDDVTHCHKLLNSKIYMKLHIACRHFNITVITLSQNYVSIPPKNRKQMKGIFLFNGATGTEIQRLSEEHCPAGMKSKDFEKIINYCINDRYNFIFINKFADFKEQIRHNLDKVLRLK